MTTTTLKRRLLAAAAACAMGLSLMGAATPSPAAQVGILAADMTINLQCRANGTHSFNVTLYASPNRTYSIDYQKSTSGGGGGGGSFRWTNMGNIVTGSSGIGTSNTVSWSTVDYSLDRVTIRARVAGIEETRTVSCAG